MPHSEKSEVVFPEMITRQDPIRNSSRSGSSFPIPRCYRKLQLIGIFCKALVPGGTSFHEDLRLLSCYRAFFFFSFWRNAKIQKAKKTSEEDKSLVWDSL